MHLTHHYIAFAAGRGIAPLLPIVQTLLSRDGASRVQIFYGNQSRERAGFTEFAEQLLALKDRYLDRLALYFMMSREPQEIEWLNGRLDAQKIEALAGKLFDAQRVRQFLVCGPGAMSAEVVRALGSLGVDAKHIRVEPYGSAPAPAPAPIAAGAVDVVQVAVVMDGRRRNFSMQMNDSTLLEAATQAGIELPFSCKAGVCSTCRTKLVRGQVELAQNYALEDWEIEQGFILACQAKPRSLDLEITYDQT